ncbi:MAG: single-stranded-DNA-specific exonuclease RecJ [Gammaproteobacteria bacterium]|nr:single-stranded-DNA-specific exonuclease RecJ [Gammaproteobacteria bacterium]
MTDGLTAAVTIVRRPVPQRPLRFGVDLHPVIRRIYANRGIRSDADLNTTLGALAAFDSMGGVTQAAAILRHAIAERQRILIVGDFDADGATSCALMVSALRAFGAPAVDYLVPNRFDYGYGLSPDIVALALQRSPAVLVTVDNGISSVDGVAAARDAGVKVIVTDHHLPGPRLPDADAIVNPNLPGDEFPSKHLAGVGVAFYLMAALRAAMREDGTFNRLGAAPPNLAALLDLVALGTVADVVPLDHNNRVLVRQGLARIRAGRCRPGIKALLAAGGRRLQRVVAADLGFAAAPRLNAAGRLDDMSVGIECLLAQSYEQAAAMAGELDGLNLMRREIESDMQAHAWQQLKALAAGGVLPAALALASEDWHPGVVGIIAARVKDRVHKPVVAFAPDGENFLKGSARSIEGLHIKDVLERIAAVEPSLIERFGGHAMAAGLTIRADKLENFRTLFADTVAQVLGRAGAQRIVWSDGELPARFINLYVAEALRREGPWGQGFAEPVFDGTFSVLEQRIVAQRHLKLRLRPSSGGQVVEAIGFGMAERHPCPARIRAVYRLDVNDYRGFSNVQLVLQHVAPEVGSPRGIIPEEMTAEEMTSEGITVVEVATREVPP